MRAPLPLPAGIRTPDRDFGQNPPLPHCSNEVIPIPLPTSVEEELGRGCRLRKGFVSPSLGSRQTSECAMCETDQKQKEV